MASDLEFVEYVRDQISGTQTITFKKMFGEYALYCGNKIVAFVCDNQLYLKPTQQARDFGGAMSEAPAYPGSTLYFHISDKIDDPDWLSTIVRLTFDNLPEPKPKNPKPKKPKSTISARKTPKAPTE